MTSNSNDIISKILTAAPGNIIVAALVWALSFAHSTGALKAEVEELHRRMATLEAKVDAVDYFLRQTIRPAPSHIPATKK